LFRKLEEVSSGISGGPGVAVALSLCYLLCSWLDSKRNREVASVLARTLFWWLKYCDRFLAKRDAAQDAAAANFFLGRKSEKALPDRELIEQYRGGQ
jgi:hypothetical protein